jgi:two-component system cell cycle sensor histidine kinase/response regulator CckA
MEQAREGKRTILVVDDEPATLKLISGILESSYKVLIANNGQEALQHSRSSPDEICLLLSDFQMPGMTGIALATEMTEQRPNIKVLLMSGFTGGMLVLNEGWHFLPKPFIPSQLRTLVEGLVPSVVPTSRYQSTIASAANGPE